MSVAFRTPREEARWVFLLSLVVATVYWAPVFRELDATGYGDWQWFHRQWEVARVAFLRFGEWPFWDPHHCGGVPLWSNPQAQVYSPTYLVLLPLGTTLGHKVFVILHAAAGLAGMYYLARRAYGLTTLGSALTAIVWGCSGFFAWHGSGGHCSFLAFYYLPWIVLCWRKAAEDPRWCAAVAALMGLLFFEGGHYPIPYTVLVMAFDALVRMGDEGQWWRIIRAGLLSVGITALLVAMRLAPIAMAMGDEPRLTEGTDSLSFEEMLEVLVSRREDYKYWPPHRWVWPEYGTFVGWTVLGLAALSIPFVVRRGARHVLAGALLFGALMMGDHGPDWPWPTLHEVPIYSSLHVPSRFAVLFTLYLALMAGIALDRSSIWWSRFRMWRGSDWLRRTVPWLVLLVVTVDIFLVAFPAVNRWWREPIEVDAEVGDFYLVPSYTTTYASYPARWIGTPWCYDPYPWDVSRSLWMGRTEQVRIEGTEGEVHEWGRTSQTWRADVTLEEPGRVVFNQNHFEGWTSTAGTVVDDRRRLAIELDAGRHRIDLAFRPPDWPWSGWLTALGLLLTAVVGLWPRRRRKRPVKGRAAPAVASAAGPADAAEAAPDA